MHTHEQYVSFETAKLLKRAGFDWETEHYYSTYGSVEEPNNGRYDHDYNSFGDEFYSAPTQAVAMRWLREVRKIDIEIVRGCGTDGYEVRYYYAGKYHHVSIEDTYEKAAEEAIQECLKFEIIPNEREQ